MHRKHRLILLLLALGSVLLGIPCFLLWREFHQQDLNQQLIAAIKREDTTAALRALKQGADANARDEPRVPGWQRIWDLVRGYKSKPSTTAPALVVLLQGQRQVTEKDPPYRPKENVELVKALLLHHARLDVVDRKGHAPLWFALSYNQPRTARLLIEQGANVAPSSDTDTLLNLAIWYCNDADLVELMLQHGANPNCPGDTGMTPLVLALLKENPSIVRGLLRHHVEFNVKTKLLPNTRDFLPGGMRPLEYAEINQMPEIARLLRHAGARR